GHEAVLQAEFAVTAGRLRADVERCALKPSSQGGDSGVPRGLEKRGFASRERARETASHPGLLPAPERFTAARYRSNGILFCRDERVNFREIEGRKRTGRG